MHFLYDKLIREFGLRALERVEIPTAISGNLKFEQRKYQKEAFQRFILCYEEQYLVPPFHLLFNMATGSGKTMIMAGMMLYLYEKGYRNFLFFVNSNNIVSKTRDNFLNTDSSKYLFAQKIIINNREVSLKEVKNFDEADTENINIKFTSVQQLHIDLNNTKENSLTFEDFQNKKVCLIADEAHHLSSGTRSGALFGSWEGTVLEILKQNSSNLLLEFTATLDYESTEIMKKYEDKILYKYDLKEFRIQKYSKEINLIRSMYDEKERIIQALLLNIYRQELAIKHHINLKPVILFKAKKTIAESEQNKIKFHHLIEELTAKSLIQISDNSTLPIIEKVFSFFEKEGIDTEEIVKKIKNSFKPENCLSANESDTADKKKKEEGLRSDYLLHTLEESKNPIRAIFAVQKLNEGWDVLNLFDIVRLYEGQNSGGSNKKLGATTIAEAQLIGRGARYYPFQLNPSQDKYMRKFDHEPDNDLKVLEELYYHTQEDSRYISELKKALIETGIYDDENDMQTKQLVLKLDFKATDFYKTAKVYYNKKVEKNYKNIHSFADLGVKSKNIKYKLASGIGKVTNVFDEETTQTETLTITKEFDKEVSTIPKHIIQYAITQNPFYYYANLIRYFPNIRSISNFIASEDYLGDLVITFVGATERLQKLNNQDYLQAIQNLLQEIELEMKNKISTYESTPFELDFLHNVFKNKTLNINKNDERANGQEALVANEPWYAYNANYGTSEEKSFVELFARKFADIKKKYNNIYLIRNERALKIYDQQGRAFEPDFLLFCQQIEGEQISYQIFIEPKGIHLRYADQWKENFLNHLRKDKQIISIHSDKYLITGVPFYNSHSQNEFYKNLEDLLDE